MQGLATGVNVTTRKAVRDWQTIYMVDFKIMQNPLMHASGCFEPHAAPL
jgi:hypothetical protein